MDWQGVREKVVVGVITAVVLGGLALVWNFTSEGGLIRLIGGVPAKDLNPELTRLGEGIERAATKEELRARTASPKAEQLLPRAAVVAFDRDDLEQDRCPAGWRPFKNARARVIVGAGDPGGSPGKLGFDENAQRLTHYVLGQHGGSEVQTLKIGEMPNHLHMNERRFAFLRASGENVVDLGSLPVRKVVRGTAKYTDMLQSESAKFYDTKTAGEGNPHNNMPPFIALYFCKKD